MQRITRFLKSEDGPAAVEYAILIAGILLTILTGITLVGGETLNFWTNNQSELGNAYSGGTTASPSP